MYSKKVKLRFVFIIIFLTLIAFTTFTVLKVLKDNVVYFKSPSEINLLSEISNKKIRVGGMVKKDSVMMNNNKINFIITDFKNELYVTFSGTVPNLFEEEKDYKICINNKEVIYSNENYFKTFNDTFNGINNIINFEIDRGTIDYDIYDAHLNFQMNNKLFKKVSNYIN